MRAMIVIAMNELRLLFNDRSVWINLLVIPLVLTFAMGSASRASESDNSERILLDVIDQDSSALSTAFLREVVAANDSIRLCFSLEGDDPSCALNDQTLDEALAQERLEDNVTAALLIIPEGFDATSRRGEPLSILYRSNEGAGAQDVVLAAVQVAATRASSILTAARAGEQVATELGTTAFASEANRAAFVDSVRANAQALWEASPIIIDEREPAESAVPQAATGFRQAVPGMSSMYVLFAVLPMSAAFIRDRKQWTIQRAMTMPISPVQIMGGKLLGYFVMGLLQLSIILSFGYLVGVRFGSDPLALLSTMTAYTLAVTGLALFLTTVARSEGQISSLNLLVTLTLAPLGGAWWPLAIVPEWMRVIGHLSPIAWAMDAYSALIYHDAGLGGVILPVGALLGMAALFFAVGVRRFQFE